LLEIVATVSTYISTEVQELNPIIIRQKCNVTSNSKMHVTEQSESQGWTQS